MNIDIPDIAVPTIIDTVIDDLTCMKIESVSGLGLDEVKREHLLGLLEALGRPMTWDDVPEVDPEELMRGFGMDGEVSEAG